jgi:Na+-transporting NADH:ubiquinone oxidoreductase subunit C
MYSNFYVFRYAGVMVVVVAAVLSAAAMFLKPMQEHNIAVDKMKGILAAANLESDANTATDLFSEYITKEFVISPEGEVLSVYEDGELVQGDERAFDLNLKRELYRKSVGEEYHLPLYAAEKDGETLYIIPLLGKGLWGPIYGNIALGADMNTIRGAQFQHDKETPGLGAEIDQEWFKDQFIGKKIFDDNGNFVSVKVVKGGAATLPDAQQIHGVDAVSGGTITSDGVTEMVKNVLESYVEYFKKQV